MSIISNKAPYFLLPLASSSFEVTICDLNLFQYSKNKLFFPDTLNDVLEKQQPITLLEKDFLEEAGAEIDSGE